MQFDDRLATVLRTRADSDAILRTQFRQLLDLLGAMREDMMSGLVQQAYGRLGLLMEAIPQDAQSQILREPGLRLRNPKLIGFLAQGNAKPAAAAMATARLEDAQWIELIPHLPITARGFMRHRRDISPAVKDLLAKLGVGDLVLPVPQEMQGELSTKDAEPPIASQSVVPPSPSVTEKDGIGALLRRIEAFREGRRSQPNAPLKAPPVSRQLSGFEFTADAEGYVHWADDTVAPLLVGLRLTSANPGLLIKLSDRAAARLKARQPVHAEPVTLDIATEIAGEWRIDAVPLFDPLTGGFTGYGGCLRRPAPVGADSLPDDESDAMRQVLHELRTPVNAIQGFAEIIQQQLFGSAPHQYRAHAAAIAVDAAKLLAGFDEVDRLVSLEGAAMVLEPGEADLHLAVADTVKRLEGVLRSRNAGFSLIVNGADFTFALERTDALALCWRLLATAAGAISPGDEVALNLSSDGETIQLELDAPGGLTKTGNGDTGEAGRQRAVNAGMFGTDFTFRLAQAEAHAAGGKLICKKNRLTLTLPTLTHPRSEPSPEMGRDSG